MNDRKTDNDMTLVGITSGTSSFSGKEADELLVVLMDNRVCHLTFAELKKFAKMRFAAEAESQNGRRYEEASA